MKPPASRSRCWLAALGACSVLTARTAYAEPNAPRSAAELPGLQPGPDRSAVEQEERVLRMGIAGGMMFAQTYTTTALVATGALLLCWYDREGKYCGLESAQSAWYELYIPVAGPFVTLRHEEVRSNWVYTAVFTGSGVLQTVGATLAVVSLLWPSTDAKTLSLPVSVVATRDTQTLAFNGTF